MIGAILVIVGLLLFVPILLVSGMVGSAILGWALKSDAEDRHAGSELIDLNT